LVRWEYLLWPVLKGEKAWDWKINLARWLGVYRHMARKLNLWSSKSSLLTVFQGIQKWTDGRSYEGQFLNNLMHGFGRFSFGDGTMYEGFY
jgi:hypothetical protein